MPKENLIASSETKDFFKELPIPKGINGNEVNGKSYFDAFMDSSKGFSELATITETYRRMQDFYETINSGRFFLANSQRQSYSEIYSGNPPVWANNWVKSQYVNSAIHSYSASFDIFLQVIWISFELYKHIQFRGKKKFDALTENNFFGILESCNVNRVESQESILGENLAGEIKRFHNLKNTKDIRDLCKQIKHRQSIEYLELSSNKHPLMIQSESYNSHNTLSLYSIDNVIKMLKQFHMDMTDLSNYAMPIIKNKLRIN